MRIEALEQGISDLKNVQELSELLSIKYNPFLDEEEDPAEGRHSPSQLIRTSLGARRRPWEEASPEFLEAWAEASPPASPQKGLAHGGAQRPSPGNGPTSANGHTRPSAQAQGNGHARTAATTPDADEAEQSFRSGQQRSMYNTSSRHVANARESFLAMHWFTYLSQGTQPSIIFLYLDYYRYVGWIDADAHEWLWKLAEGVATPRAGAQWADFGMDVQRLSSQHLRNLRFIDKLLGTTLQHGEAEYLRQTVDMLLMED